MVDTDAPGGGCPALLTSLPSTSSLRQAFRDRLAEDPQTRRLSRRYPTSGTEPGRNQVFAAFWHWPPDFYSRGMSENNVVAELQRRW